MVNIVPLINEDNFAEEMKNTVEPFLSEIRKDGYFVSFDGNRIHYEAHTVENARGNIVIVHGFTEFAEKFREMAYYFVKNGFNAFAIDNRGHGHSYRMPGDICTVKLNKFADYVEDLNIFATQIVKPFAPELPMYVYSHSMGGGIAARYIQTYPDVFEKAILSSPMICAQTGVPVPLAKTVMNAVYAIKPLRNRPVPGMCKFNPNPSFEDSSDTSFPRFSYYLSRKIAEPNYRTSGPSFGWVREAVRLTDELLDDDNCKRISAKVLIFQPEQDAKVISSYQNIFADKVADAEIVHVKGSKHECFATTNDVLQGYLGRIFDFLL